MPTMLEMADAAWPLANVRRERRAQLSDLMYESGNRDIAIDVGNTSLSIVQDIRCDDTHLRRDAASARHG